MLIIKLQTCYYVLIGKCITLQILHLLKLKNIYYDNRLVFAE